MSLRPWQVPFYPAVVAPLPVMHLWAAAPAAVSPVDAALHVLLGALVAAAIGLAHLRPLGPWRAALVATVGSVALLWPLPPLLTAGVFLPVAAIFWLLPRAPGTPADVRIATFANGLSLTLFASTALGLLALARGGPAVSPPAPIALPGEARPDVWWILLDGHARSDQLQARFGVADTLGPGLVARGFQVAPAALANYCQTLYSVSAALELDYLGERSGLDRAAVAALAGRSRLAATFEAAGYRTVFWPGGYHALQPALQRRQAPLLLPSEVHLTLARGWLPVAAWEGLTGHRLASRLRHRFVARTLARVTAETGPDPAFNLVHVLSPHPPFVVGPDGGPAKGTRAEGLLDASHWEAQHAGESYRDGYARQVGWLQPQVLAAIDRVQAGRPAVIVVSSDHGSGLGFDWSAPEGEPLRERLSAFLAIYLPEPPERPLPPALSPVNAFRYVLDEGFGTSLGLLPDRSFRQDWERPEALIDVTDAVR